MAGLGRRQRAAGRRRRRLASRPRRGPAPTRAGPRGGHGTPGHAGRDGRGHRPRAEPAADRHPGPDPRRRTHAGRRRRTARRARGPAGQRRPGPPRGRHHRPHARAGAPARPPRARRWIPRRWRIRCASCASRSWRARACAWRGATTPRRTPAGRPRGAGTDPAQPGAERRRRAGRHARRRRRPGADRAERRGGWRPLPAQRARQRPRHRARGAAAPVPAVLHHPRARHGPGPGAVRDPGRRDGCAHRGAQPDARRRLFHRAPAARRSPP